VDKRRSLLAIPSTEGLGAVLEPLRVRPWPSHTKGKRYCETFEFDCLVAPPKRRVTAKTNPARGFWQGSRLAPCFTSCSVPEPIPVRPRLGEQTWASRAVAGERPAEGRAATTRLTP
jgi:hypothetical protein